MAESQIRWRRSDYVTLGKAVANFNRKINELNKEEKKLYLPETIDYSNIKEDIVTRRQLNNTINSLRRFMKEGATDMVVTSSGEKISEWEKNELSIQARVAVRKINKELAGFDKTLQPYTTTREITLQARKRNIQNIFNTTGKNFENLKDMVKNISGADYQLKKAVQFKENYYKALEQLSGYNNYKLLKEKLDSIKNPKVFFDFVNKSTVLTDLFLWYEGSGKLYGYGGFNNNEEAFDYGLEELGIL